MGENAIAAVSEALQQLLAEAMLSDPPLLESREHVVLASPAEMVRDRDTRLAIFLYRLHEHVLSRPEAMHIQGPLGFVLSYLIVPIGPEALPCQRILARVLRTLHVHAQLQIQEAGGELTVAVLRHQLEEATRMWSALRTPYRCAVYCEVRIARLGDAA